MKKAALCSIVVLTMAISACARVPQTYAASCSTPSANWRTEKDGIGHLNVVMPVYVGSDGSILWSRNSISDAQLQNYMDELSSLNPVPQVVLEFSPSVPCERVRIIRSLMDATPVCQNRYARCSEGVNWKAWPITGGP